MGRVRTRKKKQVDSVAANPPAVTATVLGVTADNNLVFADALRDSATALSATLHLDEVLDRILTNLGRVIPHETAAVLLVDAEEEAVRLVRLHGFERFGESSDALSASIVRLADLPNMQLICSTRKAYLIADTWNDPYSGARCR